MSSPSDHPSKQRLLEYLLVKDTPEDAALVRDHLEQRCLRCLRKLHVLIPESHPPEVVKAFAPEASEEEKSEAFRWIAYHAYRVSSVIRVEEALAPDLFGQLLKLAPEERRKALRETTTFRFLALAEHLVERSREKVFEDPAQAIELADLAVEASESLKPEIYPRIMILEAQALAWAALGNARRVRSDLIGAERAFGTALGRLKRSGGKEPCNRGEVLSLLGSLRIDQTRFEEARKILEEAVAIFRNGREPRQEAKTLIQLGKAACDAGAPEEAVPYLQSARELLDEQDARLRMMAGHTLAMALLDAGRLEEAEALVESLAPEYEAQAGEFWTVQRRKWLAARLAMARGAVAEAEALFREIRDGFLECEIPYDYALATLEHAGLLLGEGRVAEVRALAEEMVPLFASRQIHGHALAALALFQQAAAAQEATTELVRDLIVYLRRARNNPQLVYPGESAR